MIKVIIIEDDPMVAEINEAFLGKIEGYTLLRSVNAIEKAKEEILKEKPDLILLDMFFPQGLGIDLLKWTRINNLKCDVILITADKSIKSVEEAFRYGAVDYIIKPFTFNRFKEALLQYKSRKNDFKDTESAEQELIDKMLFKEKEKETEHSYVDSIKGFSSHTCEKILDIIKNMDGEFVTAQELAKLTGVSRITARRYLDLLEREGKLLLHMEYGKVGRPLNRYVIKED